MQEKKAGAKSPAKGEESLKDKTNQGICNNSKHMINVENVVNLRLKDSQKYQSMSEAQPKAELILHV